MRSTFSESGLHIVMRLQSLSKAELIDSERSKKEAPGYFGKPGTETKKISFEDGDLFCVIL